MQAESPIHTVVQDAWWNIFSSFHVCWFRFVELISSQSQPWELFQFRLASKDTMTLFGNWVTQCQPILPCLMCHKLVERFPVFQIGRPFIKSTQCELNRSATRSRLSGTQTEIDSE